MTQAGPGAIMLRQPQILNEISFAPQHAAGVYDIFPVISSAKGNAMRNTLAPLVLTLGSLFALSCFAATTPPVADQHNPESDFHPIPAGPISDYSSARIKYIKRVAFLFRLNTDFRIASTVVENPETTIRLHFSADGKLQKYEIERGSGDPSFDMAVGHALQKSIPDLPPPPLPPGEKKPFSFLVRVCGAC
jgi:TonB C terminal